MIKNYIILAHKAPEQLQRMITQLDDEDAMFFIHLDAKADLTAFEQVVKGQRVQFISQREHCLWGDFSLVKATIHLMEAAYSSGREGFTILLSGQDFPIKSKAFIDSFLSSHKDENFIDVFPIEKYVWDNKMVNDKIHNYHFINKKGIGRCYPPFISVTLRGKIRMLRHMLKGKLRYKDYKTLKHIGKREPIFDQQYAGSQWWSLNFPTLETMLTYIKKNYTALETYYRYTSAPDEVFFQSILVRLAQTHPEITYKPTLTYTDWSEKKAHPKTFRSKDIDELIALSDHLFARKFDAEVDSEILNAIEDEINN